MTSSAMQISNGVFPKIRSFAKITPILDVPDLIDVQKESFNWFKTKGLEELFKELSPIEDNPAQSSRFSLSFVSHEFEDSRFTEEECRAEEKTFDAAL